ncbi:armadillo-type protein [Mycena belliarum]|uniref:Armadillo-type protein n=1 Tax=Mycena belliarum TaxID=1033014 RepID=A0AAD6XSK3_9AGAR|nr:armadillo-type protein [Mycena belliae]
MSLSLAPLAAADVDHAVGLIQAAYEPAAAADPAQLQSLQTALLTMQRTPAAWGLVVPLLAHVDASVQFFGAHTAHSKISRGDLAALSTEEQLALRDALLRLAGVPRARVVRRKLYGALVALALRLVPGRPSVWDAWVQGTVGALVEAGAPSAHIHDFLAGAAEDVGAANLLPQPKLLLTDSLRSAAPLVLQSVDAVLSAPPAADPDALPAALACLSAWLPSGVLPAPDVAALIPRLIPLLASTADDGNERRAASNTLQDLLARPPASWGAATLLEPLFLWAARTFPAPPITNYAYDDAVGAYERMHLRAHARLLVALGDAGVEWIAAHLVDTTPMEGTTRAAAAQGFLRLMLALTAADPGGADDAGDGEDDGEDDEEGGAPLGFWYLLQEALWDEPCADAYLFSPSPSEDDRAPAASPASVARTAHAQGAYVALVRILRGKVAYPAGAWSKDRMERLGVYRRDVGDTLVNAYYILRDDLLAFYVSDVETRLAAREAAGGAAVQGGWEDLEATLHCLRAVHEALDPDAPSAAPALTRVFAPGVWERLPTSRADAAPGKAEGVILSESRMRRTALGLVDTYSSYFATRPAEAVLPPLRYVLGALRDADRGVCLQAALALRSLCDANRRALAERIGAFAEVHAGLGGVPDTEKGKVLQSIASVIQALPPAEAIAPVEALVTPILERLGAALGAAGTYPEPARATAILQLEIIAGVAKGLTRSVDPLAFDEDETGDAEADAVRAAREDPRTGALRSALFDQIARVAELWSADAEIGQALSELCKAITALPADVTLLSLPAQPLLGVVCRAAARQLTAVWLALASLLIAQLNPPPLILTLKSGPTAEAEASVREALGALVGAGLRTLGAPGGMVENPDIVQEFFACMDRTAQDFTGAFCTLPDGAFDALMQCAISTLALQERYSLVAGCTFLGTLIHRTALWAPLEPELLPQMQAHMIRTHGRAIMRAVLCAFAGAAPRSVTSNLLELLSALVSRWDEKAVAEAEGPERGQGGARAWLAGIVLADDFFPSKAGHADKERFVKTVVSSRSVKKTKEAANQFSIIAWGLEGSTFGYSSV